MRRTLVLVLLITVAVLVVPVSPAGAQDPVTLSPKMYSVLLENEHVRVMEFRAKAGEKEPTHSHPAAVIYAFKDGKARLTTPDGRSEERESKAGTAFWSEPVTHSYENLASTDAHVLIIELKAPAAPSEGAAKGAQP